MAFICFGADEIAKLISPAAEVTTQARAALGGALWRTTHFRSWTRGRLLADAEEMAGKDGSSPEPHGRRANGAGRVYAAQAAFLLRYGGL
jgi:hypothetical protein